MNLLTKSFFSLLCACSFVMSGAPVHSASDLSMPDITTAGSLPLSVNSTVVTNVTEHTARVHIFSEKINMTATVGELWQAKGDVLYQTDNHDVTDLAKGDDGRYAVKFTKPGEATIRVYLRKNDGLYIQDFLFRIKDRANDYYVANKSDDNVASGTGNVYTESNRIADAFPEEVLQLVNRERAKAGARPLRLSKDLLDAAAIRAEEISRHFSHTRPDGRDCFTLLRNRNHTLGENIAGGNPTPAEVVDSWMHSPGHRANILNKSFKELGVGYYRKDGSAYTHYWIQMFRG